LRDFLTEALCAASWAGRVAGSPRSEEVSEGGSGFLGLGLRGRGWGWVREERDAREASVSCRRSARRAAAEARATSAAFSARVLRLRGFFLGGAMDVGSVVSLVDLVRPFVLLSGKGRNEILELGGSGIARSLTWFQSERVLIRLSMIGWSRSSLGGMAVGLPFAEGGLDVRRVKYMHRVAR